MSVMFRAVLTWLLVVALPAQGFAAATMLNCGPNHHRPVVMELSAHAHDHASHGHSGQHGAAATAGSVDDPELAGTSARFESADMTQAKCSACANCCSALAILSAAPVVAKPRPAVVRFPVWQQPLQPVDLSGLKRPPRPFFA